MEPFQKVTSIVTPLDKVNVDTDQIIPKQFLKLVQKSGFGKFLFFNWRYDENENLKPDFVLNDSKYNGSKILVAGDNFGCGSSREHAVWSLIDYGFKVVIAESFADIFKNNCFNNGLLPISLEKNEVSQLMSLAENGKEIEVDLENQIIFAQDTEIASFEIDPFQKKCILQGLDEIGLSLTHAKEIKAFEDNHRTKSPWIFNQVSIDDC